MNTLGLTLMLLALLALAAGVAWWWTRDSANVIVTLILGGLIATGTWVDQYFQNFANDRVLTCHVTGKDRGGDNGSYRVYTSDCGTLSNHDSWFRGKTNSGDVQGQIPDKGFITIHVAGSRFGLMSWMPNILEVKSGK